MPSGRRKAQEVLDPAAKAAIVKTRVLKPRMLFKTCDGLSCFIKAKEKLESSAIFKGLAKTRQSGKSCAGGQQQAVCMRWVKLGAAVAALSLGNTTMVEARQLATSCANASEISAVQVSAVVQ